MVILGLGSNHADRLQHLRLALHHIKKIAGLRVIAVSPVYVSDALLPDNAPASWDKPYLNLALRCETSVAPYDLLAAVKNIEVRLGRKDGPDWGPRPVDIDLLAWDDLIQYDEKLHIPHEHLTARPFALFPFSDVAPHWVYPLNGDFHGKTAVEIAAHWGSRFNGAAPFRTRQILQRIDAPQLVGIINITPDSFTDGGLFVEPESVVQQARALIDAGAEILDIGAEASNPAAQAIGAATEWQRLEKMLTTIMDTRTEFLVTPKISVDTRHAATAQKALALGVDWINDVSGLTDTAIQDIILQHTCDVVMMHQLGIPADRHKTLPLAADPVQHIYHWAETQLAELGARGLAFERIIFDVGIGFGKTADQSLEILRRIDEFKSLPVRLLVGHSRKSFFNLFTDKAPVERDVETLTASLHLAQHHIDYLRLHNVEHTARAFKLQYALNQGE
jgi:2-amino-4-hydroxy-6-hydroxymethyldihydropteridine diphosphokinase/dihydropteroate synthase